jgi:phosphoglycolate phosphatase
VIPRSGADALALVVFDWDGTLMDSIGRIVRCLHLAIAEIGAEPRTDPQLRDIIGLGVQQATQTLYPGADAAFTEALTRAYRLYYLERDTTPTPLYPDAEPVLRTLSDRGFLLAVATGKSRRGLKEALESTGLGHYFDATATSDEHPSKPHPAMLGHLIERLGVERENAVMVGDSTFDLEMARSLRVTGVGVTHGAHDAERLRRCAPAALIERLAELPPLLVRDHHSA